MAHGPGSCTENNDEARAGSLTFTALIAIPPYHVAFSHAEKSLRSRYSRSSVSMPVISAGQVLS